MKSIAKTERIEEGAGCMMQLMFNAQYNTLHIADLTSWLNNKSGLCQSYREKIMMFELTSLGSIKHSFKIRFDASANCFEAMQQITDTSVISRSYTNTTFNVTDMSCPHGQFKTLTLHPKDFQFLTSEAIHKCLPPYGEICSLKYLKTDGLRDGRAQVVLFVPPNSKLWECDKEKKVFKKIEINMFKPGEAGRASEDVVQSMWLKYGPNGTANEENKERALALKDVD